MLNSVEKYGNPVPAGSLTYTWVATNPDGRASGYTSCNTNCGSTIINTVTNLTTQSATVIYTITPHASDCPVVPFVFTLTVEPMPDFSISNSVQNICPSSNTTITPLQITNNNMVSFLGYTWSRSNTANLYAVSPPATQLPPIPLSGNGIGNGLTLSGTLQSKVPNSLQTSIFTINAQVNGHTCVSKTAQVTVGDVVAPSITCPGNLTFDCADKIPLPATDYTSFVANGGSASDNCTSPPLIQFVSDVPSGPPCSRVIQRAYRAIDYAGNYSDCIQQITVTDNLSPAFITVPAATMSFCVFDIYSAVFFPPATDITPVRPDYYILTPSDKAALTAITYSDNCNVSLYWKLVDSSGNPVWDSTNSNLLNQKNILISPITDFDIKLNGTIAETRANVVYYYKYWLVDACGNQSPENKVTITIKPRPDVIKLN